MKADFHESLDALFCAQAPAIPNAGEDSFCCLRQENSAIVAVFDGCGGLGSRKYPGFRDHTGAWVASRLVCGAVHDWYREHDTEAWENPLELTESLNRYLKMGLEKGPIYGNNQLRIRGSMVRDFPSTLAMALARYEGEELALYVVWAGDSRVYLLDSLGLAQLTADDSEVQDAFENLTNDGELTNVLSSDGNYQLHCKRLTLKEPTLVFASTDGCFGYIPSPMEFEYTLCRSIMEVRSVKDLRDKLREEFIKTAGDDLALSCMSFFAGSYRGIRELAAQRAEILEKDYIGPLEQDRNAAAQLWEEYRRDYERYLQEGAEVTKWK